MKLVIGCGYLGRRVAAAWLARGEKVAALTRSPKNADELRALGIEAFLGDVTAPDTLAALPEVETLLYAVGYDRSAGRSQREVYVEGLNNTLHAVASRAERVVYVSSTSVYGQDDGSMIDEDSATEPVSESGKVCLEAETGLWRQYWRGHPERTCVVLRSAGIYGPGRLLRRIEQLQNREPLTVTPDGWLNLIHVDDLVRAVLAAEERAANGTTYVVCDDRPVRRREYYGLLAELVNAPPPVFTDFAPASLGKRCSNHRLREDLCVELAYPTIEQGLRQALV